MLNLAGVLAVRVLEHLASEGEVGSVIIIRTTGQGALRNH